MTQVNEETNYFQIKNFERQRKNTVLDLIHLLNEQGVWIIYIDEEFWAVSEFKEAQDHVPKIMLEGKRITNLIDQLTDTLTVSGIVEKITVMKNFKRNFDPRTSWIEYMPQ